MTMRKATRPRLPSRTAQAMIALVVLVAFGTLAVAATASRQAATAGTAQLQAGPVFKQVGSWGKLGSGNGQFLSNAYGLATDRSGNVYVADTDNFRIQVFTAKGGFKAVHAFVKSESVQDVAVDTDGSVWGTALQTGQARNFGGSGATIATPKQALGIAVDANGNVYVATAGDNIQSVIRYEKGASGYTPAKTIGGLADPGDVEVSADGSVYVVDGLTVKRFVGDRPVKTIKGGASKPLGIGVDLDCNLWMTNISQRNLTRVSPSGKVLGTATSSDLIAQDVAVGPKGDLYAYDSGKHSVIHFAEDRSKPGTAAVPRRITVSGGVARIKYALSGIACPAEVAATATLTGAGVSGKAAVKVAAGKATVISIPVKAAKGEKSAVFKIVLKTNGRPTTETKSVKVSVR